MGSSTAFLHHSHRKDVCTNSRLYCAAPQAGSAGCGPHTCCTASGAGRALLVPTTHLCTWEFRLSSLLCNAVPPFSAQKSPSVLPHRRVRLSCHLLSRDCPCIAHPPGPRSYHRAKASVFRRVGEPGAWAPSDSHALLPTVQAAALGQELLPSWRRHKFTLPCGTPPTGSSPAGSRCKKPTARPPP